MMDFNQPSHQANAGLSPEARHNVERLKECMRGRMESVLSYLLPAGKVQSGKFYVGDVQGNPGDSMVVELTGPKAGMWYDHATGQGSDIIELWAAVRHLETRRDFPKILDEIATWLGEAPQAMRPKPNRKSPPTDDLGPHTGKWDYFDKDGKLICCMYRYDPPNRKKTYRPYDVKTGKKQDPEGLWPLYHQPEMADIRDIVFVEGEKCADALLPFGIVATTSMHGAKAPVKKTDWSPLAGKHLLIWPDMDKVGWDYAVSVAQAAIKAGALSVAILMPPGDKPKKWDAADAVAEGMDVHEFMANAERQSMQWTPANRVAPRPYALTAVSARTSLNNPAPVPDDLIGPRLLTVGGMWIIAGPPKAGKSDLLLSLFTHASAGIDFLGLSFPRPLRIFYAQSELERPYLDERLRRIVGENQKLLEPGLDNLFTTSRFKFALDEQGVQAVVNEVNASFPDIEKPVDIIAVDPFRNIFQSGLGGGDINADLLAFFTQRLEALLAETNPGAGLVVVHHTNKISGKMLAEDPMSAISGGGALLSYPTAITILGKSGTEDEPIITAWFDIRNGPPIPTMTLGKRKGQWLQLDTADVRLIRQQWGAMNDREQGRKRRAILEFIFNEAAEGKLYTNASLAKVLSGKFGLGSQHTIRNLIGEYETKGFIRFIGRDASDQYGFSRPKSPIGYLCVEGMHGPETRDDKSSAPQPGIEYLPTHYRDAHSDQVFELHKEDVRRWEYDCSETDQEAEDDA